MSDERLKPCPITPMQQSLEMGCGPTSVAMVLSGFGVQTTEQILAERCFPTALLPLIDPNSGEINYRSGTSNRQLVEGMVQALEGLGLQDQLRVDVFDSWLCEYTTSPQERYIVKAMPDAMKKYRKKFKGDTPSSKDVRDFYQTLEALVKAKKIGVYTANARMLQTDKMRNMFVLPEDIRSGFFGELTDFVRKGHIVGPHGGMTAHIRALDGSRTEKITWSANEKGFVMLDPMGESYVIGLSSLIWLDTRGVRGDTFDYLFRVSPREGILNPQQYGIRRLLQNLRPKLDPR